MEELSIGNDIVDLVEQAPPLHPRFCSRVFSQSELERIGSCRKTLWLYWAAKEAAYKAMKRLLPDLDFVPIRFEFDQETKCITTQSAIMHCQWVVTDDFVYVSCLSTPIAKHNYSFRDWIEKVENISQDRMINGVPLESTAVRLLAVRNIAKALALPESILSISPREGFRTSSSNASSLIPRLYVRGDEAGNLLSFTHHGRFVACAFL